MNRPRLPRDLVLLFDLLEGLAAGAKRYPVLASAIGGALGDGPRPGRCACATSASMP